MTNTTNSELKIEVPIRGYFHLWETINNCENEKRTFCCDPHLVHGEPAIHVYPEEAKYGISLAKEWEIMQQRYLGANICYKLVSSHPDYLESGIKNVETVKSILPNESFIAPVREACVILYTAIHHAGCYGRRFGFNIEEVLKEKLPYRTADALVKYFNLQQDELLRDMNLGNYLYCLREHEDKGRDYYLAFNAECIAAFGLKDEKLAKIAAESRFVKCLIDNHLRVNSGTFPRPGIYGIIKYENKISGRLSNRDMAKFIRLHQKTYASRISDKEKREIKNQLNYLKRRKEHGQ